MSEIGLVTALDEARLVRAATICGIQYVAVWHGGTTVNVYCPETQFHDTWDAVTCFNISTDEGRPANRVVVDEAIEDQFEHIASEAGEEVRWA